MEIVITVLTRDSLCRGVTFVTFAWEVSTSQTTSLSVNVYSRLILSQSAMKMDRDIKNIQLKIYEKLDTDSMCPL